MSAPLDSADKKMPAFRRFLSGVADVAGRAVLSRQPSFVSRLSFQLLRRAGRRQSCLHAAGGDGVWGGKMGKTSRGFAELCEEHCADHRRACPSTSKDDMTRLRQFVAAGGHLLITGVGGAAMIGAKDVVPPLRSRTHGRPSPPKRRRRLLGMRRRSPWKLRPIGLIWVRARCDTTAATKALPSQCGTTVPAETIWWGSDSPLTNLGITRASNLALFLNCVGSAPGTRILWDEYFHGVRPGIWHYLSHTPLPWAFLQLLVLAAFLVITYARRSGALRPLLRQPRLSPLEFVETVGALYERKGAAAGALEIAYARFHFLLARRLGIPSTASAAELILRMRERPGWMSPGFAETLEQIELVARGQQVKEPQALVWVGELYDATHRMGLEG